MERAHRLMVSQKPLGCQFKGQNDTLHPFIHADVGGPFEVKVLQIARRLAERLLK